ncbi:MAG: TIM44-like domain-containing protein [Planctomycetes bacterium]|nr:TIM44-like domain-containing protein [Planctomycetota bacterium]
MHLAPFVLPFVALASQAGGGGLFGGGSGSGGGDSDDGILWLFYWLLRLAIEVPVVGVPLLIVVAVVFLVGLRKGWWKHQERVIARTRPAREARASANVAAQLSNTDPSFDERAFLARVERAFGRAQSSWCAQELEPLRAFVSDGVYERFSLQIEQQKLEGWRQGIAGLRVGPLKLVSLETGPQFETLGVRIEFHGDIHRLDLRDGSRISGSRVPRADFVECWSFVRRRGARSLSQDGLMEGRCPNCGATLALNQSALCGHCRCLVRSGRFDWVLAEITQASEWRPTHAAALPGLAELVARDPGFDVQMLEDRASMAFWRLRAAERVGDARPLTRIATAGTCESLAPRFSAAAPRERFVDSAVGSVNLLGVLRDDADDRAVVEVVWDGRRERIDARGERELDDSRRLRRTLLVFARGLGESTQVDATFTTATCRGCGAHDAGGTEPACAFCGAPRTGDRSAWLVAEVAERGSDVAEELVRTLGQRARDARAREGDALHARVSPESAAGLLVWAAELARADGEVDDREQRALRALAARLRVAPERVDEILDGERVPPAPSARDRGEAAAWYATLVELALEDGSLTRAERGFLTRAASHLGIGYRESEDVLRAARAHLFGEAREARRAHFLDRTS